MLLYKAYVWRHIDYSAYRHGHQSYLVKDRVSGEDAKESHEDGQGTGTQCPLCSTTGDLGTVFS